MCHVSCVRRLSTVGKKGPENERKEGKSESGRDSKQDEAVKDLGFRFCMRGGSVFSVDAYYV